MWKVFRDVVLNKALKNSDYISPEAKRQIDAQNQKDLDTLVRLQKEANRQSESYDRMEEKMQKHLGLLTNDKQSCSHIPTTQLENWKLCMEKYQQGNQK